MIKNSLRVFVDTVLENQRLSGEDVKTLQRDVLADGVTSREEADVLIALDRAIALADPSWVEILVSSIAD